MMSVFESHMKSTDCAVQGNVSTEYPVFPPSPLLPPCRICGEKSKGFHYGVTTCDSCKYFFMKNHSRTSWPTCSNPKQCVTAKRKDICPTCRLEKCIKVGMSKKASRLGRYTSETKTTYTIEVQKLQLQGKLDNQKQGLMTDEERAAELDQLIEQITMEHLKQCPGKDFFADLRENEQKHMEYMQLKERLYGPLTPLPDDEYERIFQETGLDADGRRQLIKDFMPSHNKGIGKAITFIKTLPGFNNLPKDDRIQLIKGSIFESDMLSSYHRFSSHDILTWIDPYSEPSRFYSETQLSCFFDRYLLNKYRECIIALQGLDLIPEEQALLQSYAIVNASVVLSPEGHQMLSAIQDVIFDAFYQLLCRNHDDPDHFFTRIISVMLKLLSLAKGWMEKEKNVIQKFCDIEFSDMILELYA